MVNFHPQQHSKAMEITKKKSYQITKRQIDVLEKIARRSKMDDWFEIKSSKVNKADIRTLLNNVTSYDVETITPDELVTLIDLIFKVCK